VDIPFSRFRLFALSRSLSTADWEKGLMQALMSADEARAIFDAAYAAPERVERVPTAAALGRVLAEALSAPEDLPPFRRSLMDGYAVRAADTTGATKEAPRRLQVVADIAMGTAAERGIGTGEAARVPTGGMLPEDADAVVIVEETREEGSQVAVLSPITPGRHLIERGEDVRQGEPLLSSGHRLRPQDVGALLGLGIGEVALFYRPRVGIISTGDELVLPDRAPGPGQIRDMNSYALAGMVEQAGAAPHRYGIIPDELEALTAAARAALAECDVLILNGGSSVGAKDHVAPVIDRLGRPGVLVHGINIRPGKPTVLAVCDGKPVFGLPGQPVSVLNTFELFVAPVLRRMQRLPDDTPRVMARLAAPLRSADGREDHARVVLERRGEDLWATPIPGVSAMISTMVRADGITVVPAGSPGFAAGERVEVRVFRG
jgi:molybdopterin molybdotransferase